jgi:hypothetical protein
VDLGVNYLHRMHSKRVGRAALNPTTP